MIDPAKVCLYVPGELKRFKLELFNRIGDSIERLGGRTIRATVIDQKINELDALPNEIIPIVGCGPYLRLLYDKWITAKRNFIYWDRGYARRVFATWLPRGENGGYYRWHLNSYQLQTIRDVPQDRWNILRTDVQPWQHNPNGHIVVACPTPTYEAFHCIQGWTEKTLRTLARITTRQIVTRDKESKRPLQSDLDGAYCLVAHGSIAAVESVILGCPVIVDSSSAAALVGITDLKLIDRMIYPDRMRWLNSLAYSQFNEQELVDGTLWGLIS